MDEIRIALANLRFPGSPEESIALAEQAIARASSEGADLVCFPECFVPGYRARGKALPPPDPKFLGRAWSTIAATAGKANVGVILGTERVVGDALLATALVIDRDGAIIGFQDKVLPLRQWCDPMVLCSAISLTAKKACSSRTLNWAPPPDSSPLAANLPEPEGALGDRGVVSAGRRLSDKGT